ncbi:MAG TPA: bifunctional DNA primase/polymerase, partial [Dehalococcoidia bacterium]|nr:bifunctional DNA primase/polymerase [Dehalococcoidia bacterium]
MKETRDRRREALDVVEMFQAWGIAVFPGPFGQKGTRVKGWPDLDSARAAAICRQAAQRGRLNIAARTGPQLAVIDLDGREGVDPEQALERLRALLPANVAVSRTGKGFHVLFRPKKCLGNGLLPGYGAELFTESHLVNLPPSRHPSGVDYAWEIPPGGNLPLVDLKALGLEPEPAEPAGAANGNGARRNGRAAPASAEDQEEFRRLMARVNIYPRRGGEEIFHCPWHPDGRRPNLSVNWEGAAFICWSPQCGVRGRIGTLRRLLGEEGQRPRNGKGSSGQVASPGHAGGQDDADFRKSEISVTRLEKA